MREKSPAKSFVYTIPDHTNNGTTPDQLAFYLTDSPQAQPTEVFHTLMLLFDNKRKARV